MQRARPAVGMRPPDARDRRLAACVGASLLLHALIALDWGFDSGRRPAQAPAALITARLDLSSTASPSPEPVSVPADPSTGEQPAGASGVLADTAPDALTLAEGKSPPAATSADAASSAADPPPPAVSSPARLPEPSAALPVAEAVEPAQAAEAGVASGPVLTQGQGAAAPQAGDVLPGAADLTWYTGRDLDVLPRPLAPVEPQFPLNAQLRGVSGKVTLAIAIDAAGRVVDVAVVRADPAGFFEASAVDAFRAVRYAPGIKDGRAVRARLQTVVVFELGPQ